MRADLIEPRVSGAGRFCDRYNYLMCLILTPVIYLWSWNIQVLLA